MDDCYSIIINDISYRMNLSGLFKPAMPITRCSESLHAFIKTIYNSDIKLTIRANIAN